MKNSKNSTKLQRLILSCCVTWENSNHKATCIDVIITVFPLHYDTIRATVRIHVVWWGCSHQVLLQAIQICLKLAKCCACICRQLQRKQNQYQTFNSKVTLIVKFCQNIIFSLTSNMHYNTPAPLYNCAKLQGSHLLMILGVSKMTYWLATIQSCEEEKIH